MQEDPSRLPKDDHSNPVFMVLKCLRFVPLSGSVVFHNKIGNIWLLLNCKVSSCFEPTVREVLTC